MPEIKPVGIHTKQEDELRQGEALLLEYFS